MNLPQLQSLKLDTFTPKVHYLRNCKALRCLTLANGRTLSQSLITEALALSQLTSLHLNLPGWSPNPWGVGGESTLKSGWANGMVLPALQQLHLNSGQLEQLPGAIQCLTGLRVLSLAWNAFGNGSLDCISSMTQLLELNLTRNRLSLLPEAWAALQLLQVRWLLRARLDL